MKRVVDVWMARMIVLALVLVLAGCGENTEPVRLQGKAIGTTYSMVVYGLPDSLSQQDLSRGVGDVVANLNSIMSLFKPDSELSRFNAYQGTDWFPVSMELAKVVATAREVHELTDGSFDVTVAPLVRIWGFGPDKRPDVIPSEEAIRNARSMIGSDLVDIRSDPPALRKSKGGLTLDLAAIAKGYCVDAVSQWMLDKGMTRFMVEIGGEIRTHGTKPGNVPWRIAVEKPVTTERAIQAVIALSGKAMATSGDYRNYFEVDGQRYSHIINPGSGRPIGHTLVSVSVVDESCMRADALATGLMVLGPEKGIELARRENLSAFFMVKTADGFAETVTGDFPQREIMQ